MSTTSRATTTETEREGLRLQKTSRTPHIPRTPRCPQEMLPKHSDSYPTRLSRERNLHQTWCFLEISLPTPGGRQRKGQREQGFGQTNTRPGLTGHEPKKVQSQHCDQKRSFGKFFSERDHEFCPLECPRAVLIGSVALTQNEHGLHPQMSK